MEFGVCVAFKDNSFNYYIIDTEEGMQFVKGNSK